MTKSRKTPDTTNVCKRTEKTPLYSIGKKYYRHAHKYLTANQVRNIFSAAEQAYYQYTPLNRFFTIHYNDYADPNNPQQFVTDILARTRKWLQYRRLPVAYVYVIEKGKTKGIHTHILLHIPAHYQREYKKALRRWLPFEWNKTTVNVKPIKHPQYGDLSPLHTLYGTLRYICKGINPAEPILGIKPRNQGRISGQRWGISESLRGVKRYN